MSTETPGGQPAAPSTPELSSTQGAPVDGGVVDVNAQPADPNAAPAGEGAPAQPTTPDPRSPNGRISHYSKIAREAELRAERLAGENEALRRLALNGQPQPQAQPAPAEPQGPVAPDPNDRAKYPLGDIDPAYWEDRADYLADLKIAKAFENREKASVEQAQKAELATRVQTAADALEAPGFERAKEFFYAIPESHDQVLHDICATPDPATLTAYLADERNKAQTLQLIQMDPVSRARAFGMIIGAIAERKRLAGGGAPASQPAPAATTTPQGQPAPIPQPGVTPTPVVTGGGAPAPIGQPPVGDMNAYRAWREKAFG